MKNEHNIMRVYILYMGHVFTFVLQGDKNLQQVDVCRFRRVTIKMKFIVRLSFVFFFFFSPEWDIFKCCK